LSHWDSIYLLHRVWSLEPSSSTVKCLHPPNITNGKLKGNISNTFSYGASVSYSCNPGYSLVGNALISCTASGTWSQPPPQCKGVFCLVCSRSLELQKKLFPFPFLPFSCLSLTPQLSLTQNKGSETFSRILGLGTVKGD
uniref:Sushi domain-containing protein n=1 Tax=Otus sunia TaxID=257818 RepID=A0A8C8ECV3_9STRI